jgi:glutathione S-transferase
MPYRLTYWPKRGRAEQVRVLLNEIGAEYEDVHIAPAELSSTKGLYFGSVPMLEDGSFRLCQGPVIMSYLARKHGLAPTELQASAKADAIALGAEDLRIEYFRMFGDRAAEKQAKFVDGNWTKRWLPCFSTLLEEGGGEHFFGTAPNHADIAVFDAIDATVTWVEGAKARLENAPTVQRFYQRIATRPKIAAYLASSRRTNG